MKVITFEDKSNLLIGREYTLQDKEQKFNATFTDYMGDEYCEFLKCSLKCVEKYLIRIASIGGVTQIFVEKDLHLSEKFLKSEFPKKYSMLCRKIAEVKK